MSGEASRVAVLFVCHANICRSPLAHALFVHRAQERGVESQFEVESAGTWAADGMQPHANSVAVGREHGADLAAAGTSRIIAPDDLHRFDHIIVMDRANEADVQRLQRLSAFGPVEQEARARVRLLRHVAKPDAEGRSADVPDPIGKGPEHFQAMYEIVNAGIEALLDELA